VTVTSVALVAAVVAGTVYSVTVTVSPEVSADLPAGTRTVSQVHADIAAALAAGLPETVWVVGEVVGKRQSPAGHVYLDLVERPAPDTPVSATLKVTCLARELPLVRRRVQDAGVAIIDGLEVRVRGRLGTYAPSGALQLQMLDIDATWTVGRIAANRDALLRRLADEGVLGRNKQRPLPDVPLRIGLVTSVGSAAYHDFCHELESSGWAFQVLVADTRVQGENAPEHIVAALGRFARQVNGSSWAPDVVVLARGGGSRTDLAAFDDERVARAIAAMPVAVLTGIGHEIDRSVADEAAHTAFKTPTAAAQALCGRIRAACDRTETFGAQIQVAVARYLDRVEQHLTGVARGIGVAGGGRADRASDQLDAAHARIGQAADRSLTFHEEQLGTVADRVRLVGPRTLDDADRFLSTVAAVVAASDPVQQLARGFTITRLADGTLLHGRPVPAGTVLLTETTTGILTSTVTADHHDAATSASTAPTKEPR
jgi:exodeoxyribonuclease VII large subunit